MGWFDDIKRIAGVKSIEIAQDRQRSHKTIRGLFHPRGRNRLKKKKKLRRKTTKKKEVMTGNR